MNEKPPREEYEATETECPNCAHPRAMRRVTHHTGEYRPVEIYGEVEVVERTEQYLECPNCYFTLDV